MGENPTNPQSLTLGYASAKERHVIQEHAAKDILKVTTKAWSLLVADMSFMKMVWSKSVRVCEATKDPIQDTSQLETLNTRQSTVGSFFKPTDICTDKVRTQSFGLDLAVYSSFFSFFVSFKDCRSRNNDTLPIRNGEKSLRVFFVVQITILPLHPYILHIFFGSMRLVHLALPEHPSTNSSPDFVTCNSSVNTR